MTELPPPKSHYRELAGCVTRAMILEDAALAVLKKEKLTEDERETMEKAIRGLKKILAPHEEL